MGQKDEENARAKAYAVAVLAEAWAGAVLPPSMLEDAKRIRRRMLTQGTWMST